MYRWIVAFDVAPVWVQDGFSLSDLRAFDMLITDLEFAQMHEVGAKVIASPSPLRIAREQGYAKSSHKATLAAIREIKASAPHGNALESSIARAIALLDSVAFVRHEGDETQQVLTALREQLAVIRGD